MALTRKEEQELILKWKAMGAPTKGPEFEALIDSFIPLVMKKGSGYINTSNLPKAVLRAKLIVLLNDALRTWDPNMGAQPNTHIVRNYIPQVGRYIRKYTNMGRIPDDRSQMIGTYKNRLQTLHDELGREPTAEEMADDMSVDINQIHFLNKELVNDLVGQDYLTEMSHSNKFRINDKVHYLYFELNPEEKLVLEHIYGMYGKPQLGRDTKKISQKTGIPEKRIYKIRQRIADRLEGVLKS